LSKSYSDDREIVAIIGSNGLLEISSPNASTAGLLDINVGEELRLYID
jgi:S-adenosylmethionine hydrolase